ncbi:MAG: hypothetical protein M0Z78_02555 [Betaproteobacteria bacterium]|jgi:hypothetical protein|nr:hypothetical protein [Betaproteobacteria bacterium]
MIADYLNSLSDGWTIYLWLVAGAMIIVASIYGIRWGAKNEQFDEDIKYLVFKDSDRIKMKPEEFAKSQEVLAKQEARRAEVLAQQAANSAKH